MEPIELPPLPLGRNRRLEAAPLANSDGDHAVLVRNNEEPRALLITEGRDDRLVLIPLDERSEMRIDGDALAIWLTQGSLRPPRTGLASLPQWAGAVGMLLLVVIVVFAILGSLTFFSWLFRSLGVIG